MSKERKGAWILATIGIVISAISATTVYGVAAGIAVVGVPIMILGVIALAISE